MRAGEKIKNRRLELNMTMESLGKAVGVQRSAINKYEKGLVDIPSSKLSAIAHALDIPVKSLLDDLDSVQDEQHINIDNLNQFSHLLQYMTPDEYDYVIAAFDKAYKRMQARGVKL